MPYTVNHCMLYSHGCIADSAHPYCLSPTVTLFLVKDREARGWADVKTRGQNWQRGQVSQDTTSKLFQTYITEGNTSGCTFAIIRITPRQEKVKENSSLLHSSPLSASKAGVSLEWREIPLGFPLSQEIPRGIPRTPQSLKIIQITPEIVQ